MLNKVMIIGRLGKDPEFRTTASGVAMAKFSVATDEKRRGDNGELTSTTEWHRVVLWRRDAEVARDYLRKGSLIYLEGRIHYDSYENKEGQKVYTTDIIGNRFQMLDSRGDNQGGGGYNRDAGAAQRQSSNTESVSTGVESNAGMDEEDLPF
jgi:single-strand DNA-binding protein